MSEPQEGGHEPQPQQNPEDGDQNQFEKFIELLAATRGETPESKAKFDADYRAAIEEHNKEGMKRLVKQVIIWKTRNTKPRDN